MDSYRSGAFVPRNVLQATARSGWAPGIDLRIVCDPPNGIVAIGDGYGPTYGGHHFPLALDPALDAITRAIRDGAALEAAIAVGQGVAHGMATSRPLVHCAVGITLARLDGGTMHVAQVGVSRIYRRSGADVTLLLLDHSLPSLIAAREGMDSDEYRDALEFHRTATGRMLGLDADVTADHRSEPIREGERFLICSAGVWNHERGEGLVRELFVASEEQFQALVRAAVETTRVDAAAVRFDVGAGPLQSARSL